MKDFSHISRLMRADWDRRIAHDYRFWMSDGHVSDEAMWASGQRDFEIITRGVDGLSNKTVLDLGCGVGRLLKAASAACGKIIGLDVSGEALKKARELIGPRPNLELMHGNGADLQPLADSSIDLVISFAALSSVPASVIANYLIEVNRVLKPGGVFRLQFYLGTEQQTGGEDTLHLRCYGRSNFENAVKAAGFTLRSLDELVLPLKVSFKELGIEAFVASLEKTERPQLESEAVEKLLLPSGELPQSDPDALVAADLETWMALQYAEQLADCGDMERARDTLRFVESHCKAVTIDVSDVLQRITAKLTSVAVQPSKEAPVSTSDFRESNMRVLREKFPHLLTILQQAGAGGVETRDTAEGPVLFSEGQCLDHAQKPRLAGEKWAAQLQNEDKLRDITQVVVYGMGAAYHLEALQQTCPLALSVIEPDAAVFAAAIKARDLSSCLAKLKHLVVGQTEVPKIFDEASELVVRPQSAVVSAEFCQKVRAAFYGQRGLTSLHPRIGIVGPMQGGTLPIAAYCQRAFSILRQRNRFYDLSGFAPGFHIYDQYIFDKMRKSSAQGHYLQMLSQMLLDSIDEKPVDILFCLAQAPLTVQALEILRAKGVITVLWFMEDYLRFTYWKQMAPYYDFVFTFQRGECLQAIKAAGAGEVHYVPVGCDPDVHRSAILTEEEKARWGSPLSFVGAGYHNRQQMFASLAGLPFKIWGTEWPECRPFDRLVQERGRRLTPEEYVKIFNATDININLHSSTEKDGVDPNGDFVNPRTFELASAGAFQLVDERLLLPEAFEAGKELVTFRSTADLKDKIAYYMQRPEERRQIALAGQKRAINEHTYVHRLRDILSTIYSSRYEQLRRRDDGGGWNRLLKRARPHEELSKRCNDSFVRGEEATLDGLVADIVTGQGKLTETEMKLLFLHHVRSQIIRMTIEEAGATRS